MIRTHKYEGGYGSFLHGRRGFFFEPDNGAQGNGTASNQQQGSQQQQQQPEDPFQKFDRDLLSDEQREAFDKIQTSYKDIQGRAQQASTYQSELDRTKAELLKHQETLHSMQSHQAGPEGGNNNQPQSLEDELFQLYKKEYGITDETQARRLAVAEVKKQQLVLGRYDQQQQQRLAPVISQVVDSNATSAFTEVINNDRMFGLAQNNELQQKLWDQVSKISQSGQMVNKEVVQNLARIYYCEQLEAGTLPQGATNHMNIPTQPNQSPLQNVPGKFNFPQMGGQGNGNFVRPPVTDQNATMSPEVMAAMGATVGGWPVKPKAFKDFKSTNKIHITRNGQ